MSDRPVEWNLEDLKELIKLLRESNVSEFELRKADYRLRIKQGLSVEESTGKLEAAPLNGDQFAAAEKLAAQIPAPLESDHHVEVRSPIVGTFYRYASPGAAPFVEVGDTVRKNQILCIVEAMKIMNEIESDVEGEIRQIHVANGQPVEFGELLFSIKPTT